MNVGTAVIHHHWTHAQDQGTRFAGFPTAPNLDDFADVPESLAKRYAVVSDNAPSQIGSRPLYVFRFGIQAAALDNAEFAKDCGSVLREYGVDYVDYWVTDTSGAPLPVADGNSEVVTYLDISVHHSYSPRRVLLEAGRALARNGCLTITTPNHASRCNRLSLLCRKSVHDLFHCFLSLPFGRVLWAVGQKV